jgi:plastocyanin
MRNRIVVVSLLAVFTLGVSLVGLSCKGDSNPVGPGGADFTINIVAEAGPNSYSPDSLTVTMGQTVEWHNVAGTTHTATEAGISLWDTGNIANGGTSAAIEMNTAGTFTYRCTIHPTMTGVLIVQP